METREPAALWLFEINRAILPVYINCQLLRLSFVISDGDLSSRPLWTLWVLLKQQTLIQLSLTFKSLLFRALFVPYKDQVLIV